MSTKVVIGLIAALLVVAAGAWYFMGQGGASIPDGAMVGEGDESMTGSGSLSDLMRMGSSVKCTVHSEDPNAISDGMVYVSGGKVRADFTSAVAGTNHESSMITADGYIYTWSSAMPQGLKMKNEGADTPSSAPTEPGSVNPNVKVNYSCAPWMVDSSVFMPPANIEFMDFSSMMPGGAGMPALPAGYPQ